MLARHAVARLVSGQTDKGLAWAHSADISLRFLREVILPLT
jgi:hypothetical protein